MLSCNDDDDNNQEQEELFNCCGNTSLDSSDVNNLDESAGVIQAFEVITVNGDGLNDFFNPLNLELYPNNEVTIYNANDEVIFSEMGYGLNDVVFPLEPNSTMFPEGTYRYKIVVENEQTYVNNGFFCLLKPFSIDDAAEYEGQFLSCNLEDSFDPFLN